MKKNLILFSALCLTLCSCVSKPESEPVFDPSAVSSIIERKVPTYSATAFLNKGEDSEENKYYIATTTSNTKRIYTINNETIPYVSFADFASKYAKMPDLGNGTFEYTVSFKDDIVTVTNPTNYAYMEFNTINRIVTYYGFDQFFLLYSTQNDRYYGSLFGSDLLDDKRIVYDYYYNEDPIPFCLADYSIKDYVYGKNVFLPYETLCLLFNQSFLTTSDIYAGNAFYIYNSSADEKGVAVNNYIRSQGTEWITDEYLLSSYNNLALAFDLFYGLDQRQSRVEDGKIIKYKTKDIYSILEPYKERLLSKELNDSNDALIDLLKNEFDDGGHTSYNFTNILSDKITTRIESAGEETKNTLNTVENIRNARTEKGTDAHALFPDRYYSNGYYKENDKTAYIQFDGFQKLNETKQEYLDMNIDETNYMSDTISLFYYANEKIQNNPNIKNVIIDLSGNTGGAVYAGEYVASWICGGNTGVCRSTKTNNFIKYITRVDVNFDGVFNEKDYLSSDKNVYIIVSNGSFSCANKVACNVKDNRLKNTYFIGSRSGGGSCVIKALPFTYLGGQIRISADTQIGKIDSTPCNFISNESGVEADYMKIDNSDYASFADVDAIINKINNSN